MNCYLAFEARSLTQWYLELTAFAAGSGRVSQLAAFEQPTAGTART